MGYPENELGPQPPGAADSVAAAVPAPEPVVDEKTLSVIADAPVDPTPPPKMPWGLKWRSAPWFLTAVVCVGIMSDLLAYTIIVPVLPYRLQAMHYTGVASLMSWLLFAYSAGVFIGTFPVAYYFHKYPYRRGPLIGAVLILQLSFVLFMTANPFWCMVISRFLQGVASCVVWTVGFALLCENIDPNQIGKYLGFAFSGLSIGATIAPPIGGALYRHMGWHAPFIFVIIVCAVDTVARVLIIEKRDIEKWNKKHGTNIMTVAAAMAAKAAQARAASGTDVGEAAAAAAAVEEHTEVEVPRVESGALTSGSRTLVGMDQQCSDANDGKVSESADDKTFVPSERATPASDRTDAVVVETSSSAVDPPAEETELSPWGVLIALATIPRGTVAFLMCFVFGFALGALDATLTLRVETTWNKDSDYVGLIYLAASAPCFFVGPIAGHLADKYGPEMVVVPTVLFCLPWIPLLILKTSLPAFIVFFAFSNMAGTMLNAVASLEMAKVSHFKPGISEIHQFASMNISFSVSSAVGAIVGGQIYNSVDNGWVVVCWVCFAVLFIALVPGALWSGANPMFWRLVRKPPPLSGLEPADRPAEIEKRAAAKAERQAVVSSA